QCHPDRDGNGHTLAWRARNDTTPDGGIIEGKSRRRQDGQDGAQHLESLTTSAFWLTAGAWPGQLQRGSWIRARAARYFFAFSGSLTSSNFANSVFHSSPLIFSTLRM